MYRQKARQHGEAFLRRIHQVIFYQDAEHVITYSSVKEYLERNNNFHSLTKAEQCSIPFKE